MRESVSENSWAGGRTRERPKEVGKGGGSGRRRLLHSLTELMGRGRMVWGSPVSHAASEGRAGAMGRGAWVRHVTNGE